MKVSKKANGFTIVEVLIVIAIIGLLASLGIPHMLKANRRSQNTQFAKTLQTASTAFIQYSLDTGAYPPDGTPAQIPTGMSAYLSQFPWTEKTNIGGHWDWDHNVFGVTAGISVKSPAWNQMADIDALIDDGDLSTGLFRERSGGFIYILEE